MLYTGILALTLSAFSVVLYVTVEGTTNRVLPDGLKADMTRLTEAKDSWLDRLSALPVGKGKPIPLCTSVQTLGPSDGEPLDRAASATDGRSRRPPHADTARRAEGRHAPLRRSVRRRATILALQAGRPDNRVVRR